MELLYIILVLLVATRVCGELAERLGQPVLLGELVAGVGLGIVVSSSVATFPILATLVDDEGFHAVTELAMFFLMLLAGLELRPKEMARASRAAIGIAVGGLLLPLGLGFAIGYWMLPESELRLAQSLFLGTCLSITAVPVSVRVLSDLGKLQSKLGQVIVAAALIDDILSLFLLGILNLPRFPGPISKHPSSVASHASPAVGRATGSILRTDRSPARLSSLGSRGP